MHDGCGPGGRSVNAAARRLDRARQAGSWCCPGNWPVSGFQAAHRTETKNGAEHVRNPLLDVDAGGRASPG